MPVVKVIKRKQGEQGKKFKKVIKKDFSYFFHQYMSSIKNGDNSGKKIIKTFFIRGKYKFLRGKY